MRGGLERWKRGVGSQGVRQALAYAFQGSCDSHLRTAVGVEALAACGDVTGSVVDRNVVEGGIIRADTLDEERLRRWVDGRDPGTGERRGCDLTSPDADLILDGTINAPKSFSIAAMINPDLGRVDQEAEAERGHESHPSGRARRMGLASLRRWAGRSWERDFPELATSG